MQSALFKYQVQEFHDVIIGFRKLWMKYVRILDLPSIVGVCRRHRFPKNNVGLLHALNSTADNTRTVAVPMWWSLCLLCSDSLLLAGCLDTVTVPSSFHFILVVFLWESRRVCEQGIRQLKVQLSVAIDCGICLPTGEPHPGSSWVTKL